MRTSFNTVDVRGLRLAAAESKVDQFIKVGIPQNRKVIYILHGHGTGTLSCAWVCGREACVCVSLVFRVVTRRLGLEGLKTNQNV